MMMKKKRTEAYFKLLGLLLLTACQTTAPAGEDEPASSAATETTAPAANAEPAMAPRGWTPPAPTETPPDPSDTLAWTDYYASSIGFPETFLMKSCGGEGMEPFEVKRLVYSDTAFDLSTIDKRLEGELRFGWEPMDQNSLEKSEWNITGVQWLEVAREASEPSSPDQRINLHELLHAEAWAQTDSGTIDAKEILFTDINFDGYLDMKLLEGIGKSSWYVYLPWDPLEQRFVVDSSLLLVSDYLYYDCHKGLLHEYLGGTGSGTSWYSYEFDPTLHIFHPKLYYTSYIRNTNPGSEAEFYWENKYSQIVVPTRRPGGRPPVMFSPDSTVLLRRDSLDFD